MKGNQSSSWHRQVQATATDLSSFNAASDITQPLLLRQLQRHTDLYLKKKGKLTSRDRDARLIALVQDHPVKDVAIISCAHALSPWTVRDLLRGELRVNLHSHSDALPYLRTIVAANRANAEAIGDVEAQCAQSLMFLLVPEPFTFGQHVQVFSSRITALVTRGFSTDLLRHPVIDSIPRKACETFATHLEALKLSRRWLHAQEVTEWLPKLSGNSPAIERLLDGTFPNWRIWAAWRPDMYRLRSFESLTDDQRRDLGDLLDLEGPDFISGSNTRLHKGLQTQRDNHSGFSVRHGRLFVKLDGDSQPDAHKLLDRLVDVFCSACSVSPDALALFTHLSIRNAVDERAVKLLECVNAIRGSSVSKDVLDMLHSEANSVRIAAIIRLLPVLESGHGQALRVVLGSFVVATSEVVMVAQQKKFCDRLQNSRLVYEEGMKLHSFGSSLQNSSFLKHSFNDELKAFLGSLPSSEDASALLNVREYARNTTPKNSLLGDMIDEYCMARLTGLCDIGDAAKNAVEGLIHLWRQPLEPDRRDVALAIAERGITFSGTFRQSLIQFPKMNERFFLDSSSLVSKDTPMTCVELARQLVLRKLLNADGIKFWRDLLLSMIKQRNATLLDFTLAHLKVQAWLQWLDDLRKIFKDQVGQESDLPLVLTPNLLCWAEVLSKKYVTVLTRVQEANWSCSAIRWILMGWERSEMIESLLDLLKSREKEPHLPSTQSLLALLSPDGRNVKEIADALYILAHTTDPGQQACLSILAIHRKGAKQASEALLAAWLGSRELRAEDKRALEAVAEVLLLHIYAHENPPPASVQAAAEHLVDEHAAIMAEALRLEGIRLTLRAHNPHKTSALLNQLGIENPSPAENDILSIPNSLIDVVERIGDGEFELCFPLTHLKELQRTALGIGKARMLLVRLLVEGNKPPEFCVHLYPEPKMIDPAPNRSLGTASKARGKHVYWRADRCSAALDMNCCHGRPNRATYQMRQTLWRYLKDGFYSLKSVHASLTSAIENLPHSCLICGRTLGARLWRSTTCQSDCSLILRESSAEVRLAEFRHDPPVVDLLLAAVHASALTTDLDFLQGCPIGEAISIIQTVSNIPGASTLQHVNDLTTYIKRLGSPTESLLSWLLTSYRGFLASTPPTLKIPSMPKVKQFVLVSSAPEFEVAFAAHLRRGQRTRVVFHGTSLNRLYSILSQGLQVITNKKFQRNGAVYGAGIYITENPHTALSYADVQSGAPGTAFQNVRVVLGCELVGDLSSPAGAAGIYVVTDPSRLMVRYVFLFQVGAQAPIARHVVPAIETAFDLIRRGGI